MNNEETITALKMYRSGWANDIRENWGFSPEANVITLTLYEISGCIVLALEQLHKHGRCRDKMAMVLLKKKLEKLVKSKIFDDFDLLGEIHACGVVTSGTKHHIRVMFEALEQLTA